MLKQLITGIAITGLMTTATLSYAKGNRFDRDHGRTSMAKVVNVEPITQTFTHRVPHETCWQEEVRYEVPTHNYQPSATPALIGGLIGAAIGNSLGHSHHKTNRNIKTVAGGLLGASIGSDIARQQSRGGPSRVEYRTEERCEVSYDTRLEERVMGYDVTYRYHGETYRTRMDYDPGDKLKVRVNVRPVM